MSEPIRDTILEVIEASLEAQLGAVRRLRKAGLETPTPRRTRGKSQMDLVYDVLMEAGTPLHLKEIIRRVKASFDIDLDPDSLGSALTKRVLKRERFSRPAKNTFAVLEEGSAG